MCFYAGICDRKLSQIPPRGGGCGLANRIDGDNTVGGKCLLATLGNISFSIISERHQYFMVLEVPCQRISQQNRPEVCN